MKMRENLQNLVSVLPSRACVILSAAKNLVVLPAAPQSVSNLSFVWPMLAAALLVILACPPHAHAQHFDSPERAVEGGREALDQWSEYPWYDAESDSARPIDARTPRTRSTSASDMSWLGELMRWGGWTLLAVLILLGIYLAYRLLSEQELSPARLELDASDRRQDQTRIEALPFQIDRGVTDLLAEARGCYERGDYARAIVYLFSYKLVQLDKHQWIRLTRGKTNRQYLRELRKSKPLYSILAQTMVAFEDVFFGHYALDRRRFEASWSDLDRFESLVDQGAQ